MDSTLNIYGVVMDRLGSKSVPQREIAKETGVPHSTVAKIAQRKIKAPSVHHVQAIYNFFHARESA